MTNAIHAHAFAAYRQMLNIHACAEDSALRAVRAKLGPNANLFTEGADIAAGDLLVAKTNACLDHAAGCDNLFDAINES